MFKLKTFKISNQILLLAIGSVLITVLAFNGMVTGQSGQFNTLAQDQVNQLIDSDLNHVVEGVNNMVRAQDEAVQQQVNTSLNVARLVFNSIGAVSLSKQTIPWTAVNQLTGELTTVELPKMLVGNTWLGQNNYPSVTTLAVDEIQHLVGGTATIFQRMNDHGDMLRVATNVKNADGQRAIGTYIPAINPDNTANEVIDAVLRGETYRGSTFVVNAWYNSAYEPIRDENGLLIGMLFVGVKQENVSSLREAIIRIQFAKTGYVFVLGSDGDELGHYIMSERGERDGENVWDIQSSDGRYPIQDIVKKALALRPDETTSYPYLWQTPGESTSRAKVARIAYYAPWHWIIVASAYEDDFNDYRTALQAGQANLSNAASLIGLVIALIAGIIAILLARSISRPITQLAQAAAAVAGGNLNVSAKVTRQDEVGGLAAAFNSMTAQLRDLIGNLEQRVNQRTAELARGAADLEQRGLDLQLANQALQAAGQQAEWRARQLTISAQVAHAVGQVRDLDELLTQVTSLIGTAFGFYHVGIFIVDEINRFAVLRAANSAGGQRMLQRGHKLAVGHQGLVGYVTNTGQPRIALDVGADATHFNNPDLPDTRSEVALPLQVGGRILGALDLQTTQPGAFSSEDVVVLGTLADQIAVAIENARLFSQTLAALQETEAANKRQLREKWQRLLPTVPTSYEYHLSGVPPIGTAPLPEIEQVLRRGEVVIATGDSVTANGSDRPARSALAVPIKLRDQIIGVIDLHETDRDREWTDDEVAVLMAVADQAALALDNARLLEETERNAQRERTINEINSRVRQTVDLDLILKTAVTELGQTLKAAHVVARVGGAPNKSTAPDGNGRGDDHE